MVLLLQIVKGQVFDSLSVHIIQRELYESEQLDILHIRHYT